MSTTSLSSQPLQVQLMTENLMHKHRIQQTAAFKAAHHLKKKWDLERLNKFISLHALPHVCADLAALNDADGDDVSHDDDDGSSEIMELHDAAKGVLDWDSVRFARKLPSDPHVSVYLLSDPTRSASQIALQLRRKSDKSCSSAGCEFKPVAGCSNVKLAQVDGTVADILQQDLSEVELDTVVGMLLNMLVVMCENKVSARHIDLACIGYHIDKKTLIVSPSLLDAGALIEGFCSPRLTLILLIRTALRHREDDSLDRADRLRAQFTPEQMSDEKINKTDPIGRNYDYILDKLTALYRCQFRTADIDSDSIELMYDHMSRRVGYEERSRHEDAAFAE